ncbi:hypothetical protein TorRG33x02_214630 [Trema orientale]|uniref:Uncharacterized protein n=1 Tax=Trema orientale TaxID=63057 RepID=A0A2P5EAV8_TREOI|nr:hypothetical protein TorRG33x02_214630 [Trema orientale]
MPRKAPYFGPPYLREDHLVLTESTVYHLSPAATTGGSNTSSWGRLVKVNDGQQSLMIVASGVLWHLKLVHGGWTATDDMLSQLSIKENSGPLMSPGELY